MLMILRSMLVVNNKKTKITNTTIDQQNDKKLTDQLFCCQFGGVF